MDLKITKSFLETDVFCSYTEIMQSFEYVQTIEMYYNEVNNLIIKLVSYDDDEEIIIKEVEIDKSISSPRIVIKESTDD